MRSLARSKRFLRRNRVSRLFLYNSFACLPFLSAWQRHYNPFTSKTKRAQANEFQQKQKMSPLTEKRVWFARWEDWNLDSLRSPSQSAHSAANFSYAASFFASWLNAIPPLTPFLSAWQTPLYALAMCIGWRKGGKKGIDTFWKSHYKLFPLFKKNQFYWLKFSVWYNRFYTLWGFSRKKD